MQFRSVFDIIGPVMIGPSSSHTAGAVRIGRIARSIFGSEPDRIEVHFFGSFAETYKGHATDIAVIGGILLLEPDDERIQESMTIAEKQGIELVFHLEESVPPHPNTIQLTLSKATEKITLTGISVGGGAIQITELNKFQLKLSGEQPAILILHHDVYGTINSVTNILTSYKINISHMEVSRMEKGKMALMTIETDQPIEEMVIREIENQAHIIKVVQLKE